MFDNVICFPENWIIKDIINNNNVNLEDLGFNILHPLNILTF